jgi:hypothetical protein
MQIIFECISAIFFVIEGCMDFDNSLNISWPFIALFSLFNINIHHHHHRRRRRRCLRLHQTDTDVDMRYTSKTKN